MNLGAMQAKAGRTDQAEQTYRQVRCLCPAGSISPSTRSSFFSRASAIRLSPEFEKLAAADPGGPQFADQAG